MKKLKIVKIGGNIINNDTTLSVFLEQFSKLEDPKILVHGGGKLATALAETMNVEVKLIDGRRVTSIETLDIITMVYAGKINKTIVAQLQSYNCNALGFSGADGNTIISKKRPMKLINFGFVGDIETINTEVLSLLLKHQITPVFSPITHNTDGQLLNTNADAIASEIAIAFSDKYNVELYYCFEKNGVLKSVEDDNSVIEHIDTITYEDLIEAEIISEGMLPKLENSFYAINHKVKKVCIGKPEMLFNSKSKFTTIKA